MRMLETVTLTLDTLWLELDGPPAAAAAVPVFTVSTPVAAARPPKEWDDPRPDLAGDHAVWGQALLAAWRMDGRMPRGCFDVMLRLRRHGATISRVIVPEWARELQPDPPRWKLARGEIDVQHWTRWGLEYVDPVTPQIRSVLAALQ